MSEPLALDEHDARENLLAQAERTREGEFVILVTIRAIYEGLVNAGIDKFVKIAHRHNQECGVINRKTWNVEYVHGLTGRPVIVPYVRLAIQVPAFVGQKGKIVAHFERAEDGTSFYTHVFDETRRAEAEAYIPNLGICEHCNTKRKRNDVFVCDTDEGTKIVGSDCLKDYLGIDPALAVHALEFVRFAEAGDADWEERFFGGRDKTIDTDKLVRTCFKVAKKFGGYSREVSDQMRQHLYVLLHGPAKEGDSRKHDLKIIEEYAAFDPEFDVHAFVSYIDNMTGDFGSNLRIALSQNRVHENRTNIVLAGVGVFVGKIAKQATEADARKALPAAKLVDANVGDRCSLYGTVLRTFPYSSESSGFSCLIVSIRCDGGENLVNFHTGKDDPEAGHRYALTFTIKKHGTDKRTGEAQTVVNRVIYADADTIFKKTGVVKLYKQRKAA